MKLLCIIIPWLSCIFFTGCTRHNNVPAQATIDALHLKQGKTILCGPPDRGLGDVSFETSCPDTLKKAFDVAMALLHSFEYDESEKAFAAIIAHDPGCAMAYWGIAMSNFHPLWSPPSQEEFEKGRKAVNIAKSITSKSKRETAYIDAVAQLYNDPRTTDHKTRCLRFEKAMAQLYIDYPDDKDAAALYALALDGAADPADKSYTKQRKAGKILYSLGADKSDHPGVIHYLIHSYDYPALAAMALPAARKYATVAPSSAHAQHMPSHIFVRLGLWEECIHSNIVAAEAARCYAASAGMQGHWDEELHSLDYLMYAYLQKADNKNAKAQLDYLAGIQVVHPVSPKVVYSFAAIPSRYLLENRMWKEAAVLRPQQVKDLVWDKYPWEKTIIHFTRLLGNIHLNKLDAARDELKQMQGLHEVLVKKQDVYKARQVAIQIKASAAWILFKEGRSDDALRLMNEAATMEETTPKPPVSPGEVVPAKELLGELLIAMHKPTTALTVFAANLKDHPNRFNALYDAGLAAELSGNVTQALDYYEQLFHSCDSAGAVRPELAAAKTFLLKNKGLSMAL